VTSAIVSAIHRPAVKNSHAIASPTTASPLGDDRMFSSMGT
jgi:hypothetical protein